MIQRLFATGLQLEGLRSLREGSEVIGRIDKAVDALDQTITDIRSTIFDLQERRAGSLRAEIRALAQEYVAGARLQPHGAHGGPVDTVVPESICNELLPVLREAVSNIARHAHADHAQIEVRADAGEVVLTVTDDGVGLPGHRRESGLRNARRRAQALGGSLELVALEQGTRFVWRVPLA